MFGRKRKPKAKIAATAVASRIANDPIVPVAPLTPVNDMILSRPVSRHIEGHLGMQGYAPNVRVSRSRKRCEGCKEQVFSGVRHICIYNAECHLDTLTPDERQKLLSQLTALRKT